MKKFISRFLITFALACPLFLTACAKKAPFSKNFTGVAGAFDNSGTQTATLLLSGAEASAGAITLKDDASSFFSFVYTISDDGEIGFSFDQSDEASASGTLHGYEISVLATIRQKDYKFSGTFYSFREIVDGEVTEEGYLTAGYPLNDAVTNADYGDTIKMNGEEIGYDEFQNLKMPEKAVEIEIVKAEKDNLASFFSFVNSIEIVKSES